MRPGARTALLVVDMQNGFCSPGGSFVTIAGALHAARLNCPPR
jgi:nicotinamidase-related amidase